MSVRKHTCPICHRKKKAEQMIYSRHTGNRYCGPPLCKPRKVRA